MDNTAWIEQLKSRDRDKRKKAIIALGNAKASEALQPLANVYRNDPDEELRALALKAGRFIQQNAGNGASDAAPATEAPPAPKVDVPGVTEEARKSAQASISEALTHNIDGNNDKAIKSLKKALKLNPLLVEDGYFTGLASSILGVDASEAVNVLRDNQQSQQVVKSVAKQKKSAGTEKHLEEVKKFTWGSISLDLGLYTLLSGVMFFLFIMIIVQSVNSLVTAALDSGAGGASVRELRDVQESLNNFPILLTAGISLFVAIASLIRLLFESAFIHLSARYLFRGSGSFSYLLFKTTSLYIRYTVIAYMITYIGMTLVIAGGAPGFINVVGLVIGIYSLVFLFQLVARIGEAYNFGTPIGCVAFIIAQLLIAAASSLIGFLMQQAILSAVEQYFPTLIG